MVAKLICPGRRNQTCQPCQELTRLEDHAGGTVAPRVPQPDLPTLPLTTPVTTQLLVRDDAGVECWQATYGEAKKNERTKVKAKGP